MYSIFLLNSKHLVFRYFFTLWENLNGQRTHFLTAALLPITSRTAQHTIPCTEPTYLLQSPTVRECTLFHSTRHQLSKG